MNGAVHGGIFWKAIGNDLEKLGDIVRADVLDAWFPPAPGVCRALERWAVELSRSSPAADSGPLIRAIAEARCIPAASVLPGAGSSALIFQVIPILAQAARSAVVLDPMYGEYRHMLQRLHVTVAAVELDRAEGYRLDPARLLGDDRRLVILVNPNSPTGAHAPRAELEPVVRELARQSVVWIDETYIEYAGAGESLEAVAAADPNIIVCKSMSKVYALSGLRVAYLVSHPDRIAELEASRPPWAVSLPGQICGALALGEPDYYRRMVCETAALRRRLATDLQSLGLDVTEGAINCVLVHLPADAPTAAEVCRACEAEGVYLRDAGSMGGTMGSRTLRIAVRSAGENRRVVEAVGRQV